MSLQELYPHEVEPVSALYIQQMGRAYRPSIWHLQRSDPCDPLPDEYVNYFWLQVAKANGDVIKARQIRLAMNSHYGKLGK